MGGQPLPSRIWPTVRGVRILHNAMPVAVEATGGVLSGVCFERTRQTRGGAPEGTGARFTLAADVAYKAIGQASALDDELRQLDCVMGRIKTDEEGRTSLAGVWAGGDCIAGNRGLTVAAVEDGKVAAGSINRILGGAA